MTFWTDTKTILSPKKKDLFLVRMDNLFENEVLWWAKSVDKPSIEYDANAGPQANAYMMGAGQVGQKVGYINPGALNTFSPITITFVDPNGDKAATKVTERLMSYMQDAGKTGNYYGLPNATRNLGVVEIQQLAHKEPIPGVAGNLDPVETWTLFQPYIIGVDFGDLSYSDDSLLELSIRLGYTGFKVQIGRNTYTFGNQN